MYKSQMEKDNNYEKIYFQIDNQPLEIHPKIAILPFYNQTKSLYLIDEISQ
jgi:hypothetical protein